MRSYSGMFWAAQLVAWSLCLIFFFFSSSHLSVTLCFNLRWLMKVLIAAGADTRARNDKGETAIDMIKASETWETWEPGS